MIRPSTRLLVWFGLVALPCGALAGLVPASAPYCLAGAVGLGGLAVADALLARRPLRRLGAALPAVVRLTRDREGVLPLVLRRRGTAEVRRLRLGPVLPAGIESPTEMREVCLPAGAAVCRVDWPCTPRCRGRVQVPGICVECASPLGFWDAAAVLPAPAELRCYPNLQPERRHLAGLFLNRDGFGSHPRRQVGQGREFEKLRDYLPGDSFEDIHWRATAKRGRPITREYQIEKTQEVYVLVDASRLSARPATGGADPAGQRTLLELYIRAALVLALVARRQGDLFGLATFANQPQTFLRARGGLGHFSACRDALYTLQAAPVSPDFDDLCAFLRTRLRRRALLVFLTSLDDPQLAESFLRAMAVIGRQHVVVAAMVQPPGAGPLFREPVADADGVVDALAGQLTWEDLRHLALGLRRRGVFFHALESEALCADIVSQYLSIKQRQLL